MKYTNNVSVRKYSTGSWNLRSRPSVSAAHFRRPQLIPPSSFFTIAYFSNFSGLYILVRSVIYSAMLLSHLATYNEIAFYTHIYRIAIWCECAFCLVTLTISGYLCCFHITNLINGVLKKTVVFFHNFAAWPFLSLFINLESFSFPPAELRVLFSP